MDTERTDVKRYSPRLGGRLRSSCFRCGCALALADVTAVRLRDGRVDENEEEEEDEAR